MQWSGSRSFPRTKSQATPSNSTVCMYSQIKTSHSQFCQSKRWSKIKWHSIRSMRSSREVELVVQQPNLQSESTMLFIKEILKPQKWVSHFWTNLISLMPSSPLVLPVAALLRWLLKGLSSHIRKFQLSWILRPTKILESQSSSLLSSCLHALSHSHITKRKRLSLLIQSSDLSQYQQPAKFPSISMVSPTQELLTCKTSIRSGPLLLDLELNPTIFCQPSKVNLHN